MKSRFLKIWKSLAILERFWFTIGLTAVVTSLAGLSYLGYWQATEAVPAFGGRYTEGVVGQPTAPNPVLMKSDADKALVHLLFSPLSDITEKIEAAGSARTWEVRLTEGLTWHDGEPVTSDDIIFAIEKIQDPSLRSPFFDAWQEVTVARVSERQVTLTLRRPYAFFGEIIGALYPLPKHLLGETPPAHWALADFALKPVGNGPYVVQDFRIDSHGFVSFYTLKARVASSTEQGPFISMITLKFFSDKAEALQELRAGRIQGLAGLEPQEVGQIRRPVQTIAFSLPRYYAVFLNMSQHVALQERDVREALAIAVDRDELVSLALAGYGTTMADPTGLQSSTSSPALEAAAELLNQAGWTVGDSGVRSKTLKDTVVPLRFTLTVPQVSFLERTAELLQAQWKKIGVEVKLNVLSLTTLQDQAIKTRNYELLLFGQALNPKRDLFPFWHSSQIFYPGYNLSLWNNPAADGLLQKLREELDPTKQQALMSQFTSLITEARVAIFLYSPDYLYVAPKSLEGVTSTTTLDTADYLNQVQSWHLKTRRVF